MTALAHLRQTGLPDTALQALTQCLGAHTDIEQVWLYGSRAMGRYRPGSDIDLCVQAPNLTLQGLWQLETELDDLLLPWQIDLCVWHQLNHPELMAHIRRVGIALLPDRACALPSPPTPQHACPPA
ncbi:MAG: nucleotidyltransferase domain-containing protein [Burkholderiales bacterium]|nr:nucleotidyltransferase domain-containing protein [Burkholderiales bacterium]